MEKITERITEFTIENISLYLMLLIIVSGIFVTKYTKEFWRIKDVYKVFLASLVFSFIFYFIDECEENCAPKYLFTYLLATSFYELIMKWFIDRLNKAFGKTSNENNLKANSDIGDMPDPNKEEK